MLSQVQADPGPRPKCYPSPSSGVLAPFGSMEPIFPHILAGGIQEESGERPE